jgi:hypothetical protein
MTRFYGGKMSDLRSEGAWRERKRGKKERECGLLHDVVTDENRRRTARFTARNSSPMGTSIGEERKIERKRGVGAGLGRVLRGGGITGGVTRRQFPFTEREGEGGAGPVRAGSGGLGPGHGPGWAGLFLFYFF